MYFNTWLFIYISKKITQIFYNLGNLEKYVHYVQYMP